WVLIEVLHVGVRGRAVEVEVVFLHILPVIALAVGESEEALFQNWIALVPERQRKAESLLVIRNTGQPILAPSVGARTCLVVREVTPRIAILAVILAHRPPLPLAQVRSPLLPWHALIARLM